GNVVEGNYIGTDSTGVLALGNALNGVQIENQAYGNIIGGAAAGAGNVIAASGLPAGIVSWYRADGNAFDSVSGNNGTLQGGASFAAGKSGQAFSFDGSSEFVDVPSNANLNPGTGSFTVDAWIYQTAALSGQSSPVVN